MNIYSHKAIYLEVQVHGTTTEIQVNPRKLTQNSNVMLIIEPRVDNMILEAHVPLTGSNYVKPCLMDDSLQHFLCH